MTSADLRNVFDLIANERDDFAYLIKQYGIDPAIDLQNADLSDVKFGELKIPVLNLTGCNLDGCDLSSVKAKIITIDAFVTPTTRLPIGSKARVAKENYTHEFLRPALLAVHRYYNADWKLHALQDHARDNASPIMTIYDSAPEQDYLTKQLCSIFRARTQVDFGSNEGDLGIPSWGLTDLIWFYTRAGTRKPIDLSLGMIDANFFEIFDRTSPDRDVVAYSSTNAIKFGRIQSAVGDAPNVPMKRLAFAKGIATELSRGVPAVVVFSGFPPISKELYAKVRAQIKTRLKFIFLCSHNVGAQLEANPLVWRRFAIPAYALTERPATADDADNLVRRIMMATNNRVSVGSITSVALKDQIGSHLTRMKDVLIDAIYAAAKRPKRLPIIM